MSHQLGPYVRTAPPSWMGKKGRAHWNKQKDREEASHNKKCALLDAGVAYEDLDDVMRPKPKWPLSSYGTLTSWTDEPAPKTEEQLVAERVEKYMEGWPWIKNGGISPKDWKKLILVVSFEIQSCCGWGRLTHDRLRSNTANLVALLSLSTTHKTRALLCRSYSVNHPLKR